MFLKTPFTTFIFEQVAILLKLLFPALSLAGCMEQWRRDFLEKVAKGKEIRAKVDKTNIQFSIKEEFRDDVLEVQSS